MELPNEYGLTLPYLAVAGDISPADRVAMARRLLEDGADPNSGWDGTPLYWAVRQGLYDLAALLLEHGADPARPVLPQGWTPLMAAAWKHDEPRYVSLLLDGLGPDAREQALRERDFLGRSALYFALHKGYTKAAAALMGRGADAVEEGRRLPASWWRDRVMKRCRRLVEEADRVATIVKLRTLADPAAVGTIQSITQGRRPRRSQRQQQQEQGPAVEFHKTRIAQPKQSGKRGKGKRGKGWGGAGAEMRCSGAVVEHVCVALPQELWIELMRCWGPEHFGR